jgi:hypothetical protein
MNNDLTIDEMQELVQDTNNGSESEDGGKI